MRLVRRHVRSGLWTVLAGADPTFAVVGRVRELVRFTRGNRVQQHARLPDREGPELCDLWKLLHRLHRVLSNRWPDRSRRRMPRRRRRRVLAKLRMHRVPPRRSVPVRCGVSAHVHVVPAVRNVARTVLRYGAMPSVAAAVPDRNDTRYHQRLLLGRLHSERPLRTAVGLTGVATSSGGCWFRMTVVVLPTVTANHQGAGVGLVTRF